MTRRHHDVGGLRLDDPTIDRTPHEDEPWQIEFTAVLWALIGKPKRLMTLDQMRRGVEDLTAEQYDAMPYYHRQVLSIANGAVEKGYLTWDEINARMEALKNAK